MHNFEIMKPEHRKNNLSLGIDTEHVLDARLTRLNTWAGELRTINLIKKTPTLKERGHTHRIADSMHIGKH